APGDAGRRRLQGSHLRNDRTGDLPHRHLSVSPVVRRVLREHGARRTTRRPLWRTRGAARRERDGDGRRGHAVVVGHHPRRTLAAFSRRDASRGGRRGALARHAAYRAKISARTRVPALLRRTRTHTARVADGAGHRELQEPSAHDRRDVGTNLALRLRRPLLSVLDRADAAERRATGSVDSVLRPAGAGDWRAIESLGSAWLQPVSDAGSGSRGFSDAPAAGRRASGAAGRPHRRGGLIARRSDQGLPAIFAATAATSFSIAAATAASALSSAVCCGLPL